jgi:hypothetical protein
MQAASESETGEKTPIEEVWGRFLLAPGGKLIGALGRTSAHPHLTYYYYPREPGSNTGHSK